MNSLRASQSSLIHNSPSFSWLFSMRKHQRSLNSRHHSLKPSPSLILYTENLRRNHFLKPSRNHDSNPHSIVLYTVLQIRSVSFTQILSNPIRTLSIFYQIFYFYYLLITSYPPLRIDKQQLFKREFCLLGWLILNGVSGFYLNLCQIEFYSNLASLF